MIGVISNLESTNYSAAFFRYKRPLGQSISDKTSVGFDLNQECRFSLKQKGSVSMVASAVELFGNPGSELLLSILVKVLKC
jgi:hypothetical protein